MLNNKQEKNKPSKPTRFRAGWWRQLSFSVKWYSAQESVDLIESPDKKRSEPANS